MGVARVSQYYFLLAAVLLLVLDLQIKRISGITVRDLGVIVLFAMWLLHVGQKGTRLSFQNPVDLAVLVLFAVILMNALKTYFLAGNAFYSVYAFRLEFSSIFLYYFFRDCLEFEASEVFRAVSILVFGYTIIEFVTVNSGLVSSEYFSQFVTASPEVFAYRINSWMHRPVGLAGGVNSNGPLVALLATRVYCDFRRGTTGWVLLSVSIVSVLASTSRTAVFVLAIVAVTDLFLSQFKDFRLLKKDVVALFTLGGLTLFLVLKGAFDLGTVNFYFEKSFASLNPKYSMMSVTGWFIGEGLEVGDSILSSYVWSVPQVLRGWQSEVFWLQILKTTGLFGVFIWLVLLLGIPLLTFWKRNSKIGLVSIGTAAIFFHYSPFMTGAYCLVFWLSVAELGNLWEVRSYEAA